MSVTPTYPGVYVEEVPSGVRTITGVATSIAAFIGRALRGPVNQPVIINNYGDFERIFGGLWVDSSLGYAVRDFYLNGGGQAVIVRLFHSESMEEELEAVLNDCNDAALAVIGAMVNTNEETASKLAEIALNKANDYTTEPMRTVAYKVASAAEIAAAQEDVNRDQVIEEAKAAMNEALAKEALSDVIPPIKACITADNLKLETSNEGSWGNHLQIQVDHDVKGNADDLFNITIEDTKTGQIETFRNVSVETTHIRRVDNVLKDQSRLMRTVNPLPVGRPIARTYQVEDVDKGSDGTLLDQDDFTGSGKETNKLGLYALENIDIFNLLCIPPYLENGDVHSEVITKASVYCEKRRAMLLVDPKSNWTNKKNAKTGIDTVGTTSKNAAIFFPRLRQPNPLRDNQVEDFVPCGAIAGVIARTDAQYGIWKAPAGLEATLTGVPQLSVSLTDAENGELNQLGINCLRNMPPAGRLIWGARTLQGDDRLASEWKYIPVRRLALFIEESLYRGTQWIVFEPNDESLWAQVRLNLGAFMQGLFRQGAFAGKTPNEAYFIKCDKTTTIQDDINKGIVNIMVGFAPLKPAEFVIIKIQQMAGQIDS